jgi:hypothetical protein
VKKNINLMIATPMYGGVATTNYINGLLGLLGLCNSSKINFYWKFIHNESLVIKARNDLAMGFLENEDASHVLFIDADIGFNPEDLLGMLEADVDVIGAVYPKKNIYWDAVSLNARSGRLDANSLKHSSFDYVYKGKPFGLGDRNIVEAEFLGFGFILIKKEVFERLIPHTRSYVGSSSYPVDKKMYAFFDTEIDESNNNLLLSEDFYFCKRWRDIGGRLHVAPWVKLTHSGNYTFGS